MSLFKNIFFPKPKKINFLDIPKDKRLKFHKALYKAKANKFIKLINEYNVDINSITEESERTNFLIEAVTDCFSEFRGSENQTIIIKYLIDNGIDINHKTKSGYNALDIALQFDDLSKVSLMLIKTEGSDVHNISRGNNSIFVAIREFNPWGEEKEINTLRLQIIEELLKRNVDLTGCFFWVEARKDDKEFLQLLKKYGHTLTSLKEKDAQFEEENAKKEANKNTSIDIQNLHNVVNKKNYNKTAKVIWQKLVPKSGQAETVQGELLRAIEKLRDEAQRNGNANFNKNCHGLLNKYLQTYLIDENIFGKDVVSEIKSSLKIISKANSPYTEDDIYDVITNRIIDWYLENPKQIANIKNDRLYC